MAQEGWRASLTQHDSWHCCCGIDGATLRPNSLRFVPPSHKLLVLHFKVWALPPQDFQDCRQGGGAAFMPVWSVSSGWLEAPASAGAASSSTRSQRAEFAALFITPRAKLISVSISFTDNRRIKQELKAHRNHRERWSLAHFYLFLSFYLFGSFVLQETSKLKTANQSAIWRNRCHQENLICLANNLFSFWYPLKSRFLKMTTVFLLLIRKIVAWRRPTLPASAASYKLFASGCSAPSINLNPLLPSWFLWHHPLHARPKSENI